MVVWYNIPMKCVLTFDDGPNILYTPKILDILKEYSVKAIFFLTGQNAEKYPELVQRIDAEGHQVGNHTYSHPRLISLSDEEVKTEITRTQIILEDIIHKKPLLFRPPYGEYDTRVQAACDAENLELMIWNVDAKDWKESDAEVITETVIQHAASGSIILFHDLPQTIEALPAIIQKLQILDY